MNRKKILFIGLHFLFCILLIYWFYNNSFIRPSTIRYHPYKEIISALLLLSIIYLNYFILIPPFFKKASYRRYIFISLLLILGASVSEFSLAKNDIIKCVGISDNAILFMYLQKILFVVFLRNLSFYLFFTILGLYQQTKLAALNDRKIVLKDSGLVLFTPLRGKHTTINIDFVSYFSQNKNNTFIHYTKGKTTAIYSTLNHIQEYLGNMCLRVNKDTIITFTNIISYNNESVVVTGGKRNQVVSLIYSKNFAQNILQILREKVPEFEEKKSNALQKNGNDTIKYDKKNKIVAINSEILEEIRENPGINAIKLTIILSKEQSLRTVKRRLKELVDSGSIEYRGALKTGGYYAV